MFKYPHYQFALSPVRSSSDTHQRHLWLDGWIKQFWQNLTHRLCNDEPQVWRKVDRQGQTIYWNVYDPKSGRTGQFGSEMEVRMWLEDLYR
jgi:uncharacterized protein YaeQ